MSRGTPRQQNSQGNTSNRRQQSINWFSLETISGLAGILGLFVALAQWLLPNPVLPNIFGYETLGIALLISLVAISIYFGLQLRKELYNSNPSKRRVNALLSTFTFTMFYSLITGIVIAPWINMQTEQGTVFELSQKTRNKLYSPGLSEANISFDNETVVLLGSWEQRLWVDLDLPKDFQAEVVFKTEDDGQELSIGIANATKAKPGIVFTANTDFVGVRKWFDREEDWDKYVDFSRNTELTLKPQTSYIVSIQRQDNVFRVWMNNRLIHRIVDDDIRTYNNLFLFTHDLKNNKPGHIYIQELIIIKQTS